MNDTKPIAETKLFAVDTDWREFEIRAAIGQPYETNSGDWACPLALEGLHDLHHDIYGVDSFQAVASAIRLIHNLLSYFVADGGKLFRKKGSEEISVDELLGEIDEDPEPDWPPTEEQQAGIDKLTDEHLRQIDEAILANVSLEWRKVARVVGTAMGANEGIVPRIPDVFYAERVRQLVAAGKLESQGNLLYMRFSEIRIAED